MQRIQARHGARAMRAERGEILLQAVIELGNADAGPRSAIGYRHRDRRSHEAHALIRQRGAQGQLVAVAAQVVRVYVHACAPFAREAVAGVVQVGVPRDDPAAFLHIDAQVGGTNRLGTRSDLRAHHHVRKVAQEQERPLEASLRNRIAFLEVLVQDSARKVGAQARSGIRLELDGAQAPFEDCDLNDAVLDLLRRQVGLGEEVTICAVERANAVGRLGQSLEIEFLAD